MTDTLRTGAEAGRQNFRTSVIHLDRPGDPRVFGERVRAEAAELIARYPEGQERSALLPMLHLVQSEQGYVSVDGIAFCADALGLTKAQVAAVVTFYTMYKRKPTGEYLVSVCTNTLCGMLGGDEIFASLRQTLDVADNETTADGAITLEHAECLAACDYAPVVTVNYEFFDNQSVDSAERLVGALRAGERPLPSRGAPICSFKQIERQIAGFFSDETLAQEAVGTGIATEVGVKLAIDRGETAPSYSLEQAAATAKAGARSPKKSSAKGPEEAAQPASDQPTSAHDAPLTTSAEHTEEG
ncbi:MAG: NADH-quinone oxidoreductase subunit NuoE [Actinomycetota bacterium]|nr:NADH-quinone oxidoreductase subunit NuoE [Actinomycetota bacterium]